jgi:sugar phosphate isomerase/epimerase
MRSRISIVTDEISQDLGECRAFLDEHELDAIELRCVGGRRVPDLEAEDLETLIGWARDGAPRVLGVSPGLFKCDVDDRAETRRHLEDVLPRSIDLAKALDAAFLVTFAFEDPRRTPDRSAAVDALASAAEACAAAGLPLLVENEPGFLAASAAEIGALLEDVGHANLHVNWDPLNGNEFETAALDAGLRAIFPRVRHVHVKNGRLPPGRLLAACGPLREGAIDWPAHLARLTELGYGGHLGVETHFEPLPESSVVVLGELREMLAALPCAGGEG